MSQASQDGYMRMTVKEVRQEINLSLESNLTLASPTTASRRGQPAKQIAGIEAINLDIKQYRR